MDKKTGFNLKEIIIIIIVTAIVTSLATGVLVYNQNKVTKNLTYKDLNEDDSLKQFLEVYASLIDQYYEKVDKNALLEEAIKAMFSYLGEDYSVYMNQNETEELAEKLIGQYSGIGVTLNTNNEIIGFIKGSGAVDAGMQLNDKIVGVGDKDVTDTAFDEVAKLISNYKKGDKIDIKVLRHGSYYTYSVEVKELLVPAIEYNKIDNIGYLKILTFSESLKEQVKNVLNELENEKITSLIIDLRDNTGGFLSAARDVASMFLEKDSIIYSLEDKDGMQTFKDKTDESKNYKIIIIQNESSASASEVLIAALKENNKAITVGTTTYGKGKVQQTYSLENGGMVKYTSARWLTPSGKCVDGEGIIPDYYTVNINENEDEQYNKALELARE